MSQPTPYTPTTDFSQQEANNASGRSTVNTAALDAEFAAIDTTLDQTLANLQLLQRDDGRLADLKVQIHTLSEEVLTLIGGFRLRGDWAATTAYAVNDIAINAGYTYWCSTAHTSGGSFVGTNWVHFGFTSGTDAAQAAADAQVSANAALVSQNAAELSETNAETSANEALASQVAAAASEASSSNYSSLASISATSAANSAAAAAAVSSGTTLSFRNLLINADFRINQRVYVSAALASGAYGHDRWKAGESGGNYTFTQLAHSTQITIAASKSIIQVVEDKNIAGGSYVLSWEGTAQARYGLNSATPSGSYAASPILITGQTAGTVMSVEFNTGTLGKVQLEHGSIATSFENRPIGTELALCQRYCQPIDVGFNGYSIGGINCGGAVIFPVPMRAIPTYTANTHASTNAGGTTIDTLTPLKFRAYALVTATGGYEVGCGTIFSAEL
jgi:hypothetical protein